jgi:hypothetical protein
MPCASDISQDFHEREERKENNRRVKTLTQMLCYIAQCYRAKKPYQNALQENVALATWIEEHEAADAARLKREAADKKVAAAKRSALAKLTPEERALLEFNDE